jgi:hypothetical protein
MSTEEINTGVQWVDGKDIYRKVIASGGTMVTQSSAVNILNHGIVGFDRLLRLDGCLDRDDGSSQQVPLNYTQPSARVWTLVTSTVIVIGLDDIWSGAGNTLSDPIVIIEYTKS